MITLTPQLRAEYQNLFDSCIISESKLGIIDEAVNKLIANKLRYEIVESDTKVPWFFIGIIHNLEASFNFKTHLHNGDPLTARTVHVPKNRPVDSQPPFQWEFSATDALTMRQLNKIQNWDIPVILYQLEAYNGFGYRPRGINSPYLWSFSNHYQKGKFTSDGIFNANAISKQIGAAVLLRRLAELQVAIVGEYDSIARIKAIGEFVEFDSQHVNEDAKILQHLLNSVGQPLRIDGRAGRMTSDAFFRVTGFHLKNDPQY